MGSRSISSGSGEHWNATKTSRPSIWVKQHSESGPHLAARVAFQQPGWITPGVGVGTLKAVEGLEVDCVTNGDGDHDFPVRFAFQLMGKVYESTYYCSPDDLSKEILRVVLL